MKIVVYFKCHGHGHINNECPNARAFLLKEWKDIQEITGSKAMLISRNGKEEVVWPSNIDDDPEGSYCVNDLGILERMENTELSEDKEERERRYTLRLNIINYSLEEVLMPHIRLIS